MGRTAGKTLTGLLNGGENPFQNYMGHIPETVPSIRLDGREFASGDVVFEKRLQALLSEDKERIGALGENYFDLSDLLVAFEDSIKLQPNSGFLTGIRGVVDAEDGSYVAVDAGHVKSAVSLDGMKYFKVKGPVTVSYIRQNNEGQKKEVTEIVADAVLLHYNGDSVSFTPDQFRAINAPEAKRANIIHGRDMKQEEIIKDGKVIHFAWKAYNPNVVSLLVQKIFEFNKEKYGYDANMGFYLPFEPSGKGEGRALYASRLGYRSRLIGKYLLGSDISRLLGVVPKGVAQKLAPWQNDALRVMGQGGPVAYTPTGSYVRASGNVQPAK